jgi:hypothetical protein
MSVLRVSQPWSRAEATKLHKPPRHTSTQRSIPQAADHARCSQCHDLCTQGFGARTHPIQLATPQPMYKRRARVRHAPCTLIATGCRRARTASLARTPLPARSSLSCKYLRFSSATVAISSAAPKGNRSTVRLTRGQLPLASAGTLPSPAGPELLLHRLATSTPGGPRIGHKPRTLPGGQQLLMSTSTTGRDNPQMRPEVGVTCGRRLASLARRVSGRVGRRPWSSRITGAATALG